MNYEAKNALYIARVEEGLRALLPEAQAVWEDGKIPQGLCESMRYSLLAGGKRVRPVLLLATADMLNVDLQEALCPACALEMIHTYSLIHDDLPGMDDDDLRRGKPTNHRVYGVGPAILAGDGLLNFAFECMLQNAMRYPQHLEGHVRAMAVIAARAGVTGMIAGQSIDLLYEHRQMDEAALSYIHRHKTADLLTAPLLAAASIAGSDEPTLRALETFGQGVGIAFQIQDDLLDIEGDAASLGKATGMDAERGKMTWPALYGVRRAHDMADALWSQALASLDIFGARADYLRAFVQNLRARRA